jgi:hypothetical protein
MEEYTKEEVKIERYTLDLDNLGVKTKAIKYICDNDAGSIIVFDFHDNKHGHLVGLETEDDKGNIKRIALTLKESKVLVEMLKTSIREIDST